MQLSQNVDKQSTKCYSKIKNGVILLSAFHTNIKARREELGMSQDELAKKLGYRSRSSINKIELGINDLPQSKIQAFSDALSTTPAHLMGWSDKPYPLSHFVVDKSTSEKKQKELRSYPDYEIPPILGKFLAQKLRSASSSKIQDFISHLEVTPLSKIESWKQGKGLMNNFEYWRFHSHFGGLRNSTTHQAGSIEGVNKTVIFPEHIYEIEGIVEVTKSKLQQLLAKELGVSNISDKDFENILQYARFLTQSK